MVDTSYLIAVTKITDHYNPIVDPFHRRALNDGVVFVINVVVRHEFIQKVRYGLLATAMQSLALNDPAIRARYEIEVGRFSASRPGAFEAAIERNVESLFKHHVKIGDTETILANIPQDIWSESERLIDQASVVYLGGDDLKSRSWPENSWLSFGRLISETGMQPTDCMIANFAMQLGIRAIVTTDGDYAQVAGAMDIYMPRSRAVEYPTAYDSAKD